jgi:crossover junction endodeoxyribonuclease RuvC
VRGFRGVVLGVDPSLRGSGLAVLDLSGPEPRLVESRTLRLSPVATPHACLAEIHRAVTELIARHQVTAVALESTVYVQNLRTVATLGASRGAALAAAGASRASVAEYAPSRVKQAVTGSGKATKPQVARMVASLLRLPSDLPLDESDAAAVALCHGWTATG